MEIWYSDMKSHLSLEDENLNETFLSRFLE
jgi:hypothetical protein